MRLKIPAIVDLLTVSDPVEIAALADDPRLDRNDGVRGPLLNRLILRRIRKALTLDGAPLPPVAPHGAVRPKPEQAALEARLEAAAAALDEDDPSIVKLARFVRGEGEEFAVGPLAQEAVGRLFNPDYTGDAESWGAARVLDSAPRTMNLPLALWWAATGAVAKARRLLAAKVGGDPSGVHGTGVAVHNLTAAFSRMRALYADPSARRRTTPEAAVAQCLVAPEQVVRQPTVPGVTRTAEFSASTLVLLQLDAANKRAPGAATAFMTQSWARCPAHSWTPALLAAVWRAAREEDRPREDGRREA